MQVYKEEWERRQCLFIAHLLHVGGGTFEDKRLCIRRQQEGTKSLSGISPQLQTRISVLTLGLF